MSYKENIDNIKRMIERHKGFKYALVRSFIGNDDKTVHQYAISINIGGPIDYEGFLYLSGKQKPTIKVFFDHFLNDALNHYACMGMFSIMMADRLQGGERMHLITEYASFNIFAANMEYLAAALRMVGIDWPSLVHSYKQSVSEVTRGA